MLQEIKNKPLTPTPASSTTTKMTYEEFLAQADDSWAEWVDGEMIKISPTSDRHQDIVSFLTALLRHFVEAKHLGAVRPAPFQMKTGLTCLGVSQTFCSSHASILIG